MISLGIYNERCNNVDGLPAKIYMFQIKQKKNDVKVFNKITSVNGTELLVINIFHAIANGNIIERNVI